MRHDNRIDRELLRESLGLPDKIPADFQHTYENATVPLGRKYIDCEQGTPRSFRSYQGGWVRPAPETMMRCKVVVKPAPHSAPVTRRIKSSAHRVFVVCPHCAQEIPAGRWHQHVGTKKCFVAAVKRDEAEGAGVMLH